jgi:hypothetical protein
MFSICSSFAYLKQEMFKFTPIELYDLFFSWALLFTNYSGLTRFTCEVPM